MIGPVPEATPWPFSVTVGDGVGFGGATLAVACGRLLLVLAVFPPPLVNTWTSS
jgi:hypothetical protein